ncbi:MAG: hypothetical protein Q4G60_13135 [bacterium]|nr:hypothetical protein [bacterium]
MANKKKADQNKKKGKAGEKLALILAGIILVPTIALAACMVLAQTTDMDFDWLADKAAAIEEKADAEEAAQIAEEEAAAAAKEQAAAEKAASDSSSSSSSSSQNINVELIDSTAIAPTVAPEDAIEDAMLSDVTVEDNISEEGSANAEITGNLSDMVWMVDDNDYYHKDSSCSGMINPKQVTMQDAIYAGKSPCSKCCK